MDKDASLISFDMQKLMAANELHECNNLTARFGLTLSEAQIQSLVKRRFNALMDTGRIEFGEGILQKLVFSFCDSPYLTQEN